MQSYSYKLFFADQSEFVQKLFKAVCQTDEGKVALEAFLELYVVLKEKADAGEDLTDLGIVYSATIPKMTESKNGVGGEDEYFEIYFFNTPEVIELCDHDALLRVALANFLASHLLPNKTIEQPAVTQEKKKYRFYTKDYPELYITRDDYGEIFDKLSLFDNDDRLVEKPEEFFSTMIGLLRVYLDVYRNGALEIPDGFEYWPKFQEKIKAEFKRLEAVAKECAHMFATHYLVAPPAKDAFMAGLQNFEQLVEIYDEFIFLDKRFPKLGIFLNWDKPRLRAWKIMLGQAQKIVTFRGWDQDNPPTPTP